MSDEIVSGEISAEAAAPPMEAHFEQAEKELQQVPLSALQSERAQRQQKEQENQMLRDNMALLQANMQQHQQAQQTNDEFGGLSENDVLTVGEAKKFWTNFTRQHQLSIEELRMTQRYPDYQETVSRYLPEILKANPEIYETLKATQNYELAYYLAKNSDPCKSENKKRKINADAERIVQNSSKTGSLSSVGSASPISQSKRYRDMSDEDFMQEVNKNFG